MVNILIIGVAMGKGNIKVKIDISEVEKWSEDLKEELQSVKGARAGYYKNQAYPDGLQIAENALIQEYGTDRIPPRPFLRNAFEKGKKRWEKHIKENLDPTLSGKKTLKKIMQEVALDVQGEIVRSIDSSIPPPNAPSTIMRKKSSHTLIDSGTLRSSVHSMVLQKGAE